MSLVALHFAAPSWRTKLHQSKRMFDIVCSSCGAHDMVPFKPRSGSNVKCRTCFQKESGGPNNRATPRSHHGPRQQAQSHPRRWTIKCTSCGAQDTVPFEPRPESDVLCGKCFGKKRDEGKFKGGNAKNNRDPRKVSIPRIEHGTRVAFPITCESCGKFEILGYVPKGSKELFCTECREKKYGKNWYSMKLESEKIESDKVRVRKGPRRRVHIEEPRKKRRPGVRVNEIVQIRRVERNNNS